ncbi:HD domain-containing protein [Desulfopila sp. IMCC35006]|uniref:HD domain-containing phosphohydrolase n=1 Tax=Desulfopila sp. IMCC35006 TaxID=2569542 RepID=UPI0010ACEB86|nr:HD domain-containing phosphohydrolase [Desulfopila sp. IMCC35006]TKB28047.1 HD domain-containing protein [Desulfopila sp. IMCC35006]
MQTDLNQVVRAFSRAVDLVGVDDMQHGKRVAFMALSCAENMGIYQTESAALCRLGLLHDCGVSSTKIHRKLVGELEWQGSDLHCQIGAMRMRQFSHFASMADAIRHHHTRWEDLKNLPIPEKTKIHSNLIFLVDRVDALAALHPGPHLLAAKDAICQKVYDLRNKYFHPELVDIFLASSSSEAFWITMEPIYLEDFMAQRQVDLDEITVDTDGMKAIASLLAQIVDAKSQYTAEHSCGVASLSRHLAKKCGTSEEICFKIEVAGLLHDLGKLQVSDEILELEGPLNHEELGIMRHHSYVTYQILKNIRGFEDIALWAANHHEKLDGSGYPFHKTEKDLCLESRIIIIADIFQALAQNRPYRKPQSLEKILDHLKKRAARGQLDRELVNLVDSDRHACYAMATASESG